MVLLDLNVRNRVDVDLLFQQTINIDCEHILDLSYRDYARMFKDKIEQIELHEDAVIWFNLNTTDLLNEDDLKQYHQTLVGLFCASILTENRRKMKDINGEMREMREDDFMIGKLPDVAIPLVTMRKISLFDTKINRFDIALKCGNKVMSVTGGYYEFPNKI